MTKKPKPWKVWAIATRCDCTKQWNVVPNEFCTIGDKVLVYATRSSARGKARMLQEDYPHLRLKVVRVTLS